MNNSISTSKYTILTFIPLNLFEQFQKLANVYFLFIGFMQTIDIISISEGQPVIMLPLTLVISISALKDAYEDKKRHDQDKKENNEKFEVFRNNEFQLVTSSTIQVGEIIKITKEQHFPADILCLQSTGKKGECFIETKQLDGETNLKRKAAPKNINNLSFKDFEKIEFAYEPPNAYLYKFNGSLKYQGQELSINDNNFILRGCSLKNTDYIYGLICYTGHETKIMLNSVKARVKKSKVEILMNSLILLIFIMQLFICFISSLIAAVQHKILFKDIKYINISSTDDENKFFYQFAVKWGTWILIFTNFVPISLLVTLEMVKFFQGILISEDPKTQYRDMSDEKAPFVQKTTVQSSNLNEELGQVQYVFSDKTGTLTSNIMKYKCLTVNGISYGENNDITDQEMQKLPQVQNVDFRDKLLFKELENDKCPNQKYLIDFLQMLTICHTVITENDKQTNEIIYNASSPDELALLYFAKFAGFNFLGIDENDNMTIEYKKQKQKFKLLHVLEFNSTRKRMSVIVKNEQNQVILYTKGADSIIQKRMSNTKNNQSVINQTWENLNRYANKGLRTLLCAKRVIGNQEYEDWVKQYQQAINSLEDRDKKMEDLQDKLEIELEIIGATAIEDMLQNEVGETISIIKQAGIKVWVLTGDKIETAINIGYSCQLLSNDQEQIIIDGISKEQVQNSIQQALDKLAEIINLDTTNQQESQPLIALILTGDGLIYSMEDQSLVQQIMSIADKCEVVLACRVSPKQKQEIVSMVRQAKKDATTLAIGDGANDVNMITAAHVGIGIRGKEGQQAARASDFAIGEFKILRNLLLHHGRECYRRNSVLIYYNFYKNMLLVLPQWWYGICNGFSGTSLYDPWIYQLYNMCYTSIPIVIYAIFDEQFSGEELIQMPWEYEQGIKSLLFNKFNFLKWLLNGAWQAVICCWVCYLGMESTFVKKGRRFFFSSTGNASFGVSVIVGNLKVLLFSYIHTPISLFCIFGSIIFYFSNHALASSSFKSSDIFNTFNNQLGSGYFWFSNIIAIASTFLLELALAYNQLGKDYPNKFYLFNQNKKEAESILQANNNKNNTPQNYLIYLYLLNIFQLIKKKEMIHNNKIIVN